jgi:hypothetical protein
MLYYRSNQLQERNARERKTKNERKIHANKTNEQRKRYEISVSLNDPGSVVEHSNHTNSRNDYTEDDIIKMMEFFKVIQLPISMLK